MVPVRKIIRACGKGLLLRAEKFAGSSLKEPAPWVYRWFGGRESVSGETVTTDTATQVTAVLAAVRIISESGASLPLKLYRRVGKKREEAVGHPLYSVLTVAPNEFQTPMEFREMLQGHLCLRGNAYAFIDYANSGQIRGLIPLHPDQVYPVIDGNLTGYEYHRRSGGIEFFRTDEILHLKGFSLDGLTGLSVIEEAKEAVGIAMAAEKYGASFYGNGTHIGSVITTQKTLNEAGKQNIAKSFEIARGSGKAGHNVILDEGMTYTRIGMTAADAQFLESRKFQVTEIARMFRVPPHLLADLERATFTNIEAQGTEFVTYSLNPWLTRWEQRLALSLLRPHERGGKRQRCA